jgi:hypothetical protein
MTSQFHDRWDAILAWLRKSTPRGDGKLKLSKTKRITLITAGRFFFGDLAGSSPG